MINPPYTCIDLSEIVFSLLKTMNLVCKLQLAHATVLRKKQGMAQGRCLLRRLQRVCPQLRTADFAVPELHFSSLSCSSADNHASLPASLRSSFGDQPNRAPQSFVESPPNSSNSPAEVHLVSSTQNGPRAGHVLFPEPHRLVSRRHSFLAHPEGPRQLAGTSSLASESSLAARSHLWTVRGTLMRGVGPVQAPHGLLKFRSFSNSAAAAEDIQLTESCIKRLHDLAAEEGKPIFLRLTVEGGGCSGFQYVFTLEDKVQEGDKVIERDGASLLVDDVTLNFVKGSKINFAEELIRSSFEVMDNPHSASSCGCGASFVAK